MKLDKDAILKHKFWILLLVTVPLSLAALFLLATSVSGNIAAYRKKVVDDLNRVKKPPLDVKTRVDIAKEKRAAEIEKSKENVVWEEAYKKQEDLFLWPKEVEDEFNFRSGLFAQKIKVYRGKATPPAEHSKDDRLLHGKVVNQTGIYIEVEDKDQKKYKIYQSMNVEKGITVEGDEAVKEIPFGSIEPKKDTVSVWFNRGKYFYEPLTNRELLRYRQPLSVYLSQIHPLLAQVEPLNEKGEGVVYLKGWFYKEGDYPDARYKQTQKFLTFIDRSWENAEGDISEEAWLAQEDIWVQKELYRLIRLANDEVSKFRNVDKNDTGEGLNKVHTFRNPLLEMALSLTDNKLTMTLKNLHDRKQKLDLKFRIRFNEAKGSGTPTKGVETVEIGEEPLGPHGTKTKTYTLQTNSSRKGIYAVDQILTMETAAVKRIDQVTVGSLTPDSYSHSHRTFADDQRAHLKVPPEELMTGITLNPRQLKKSTSFKATSGDILTKHELIRNRYWECTPQYRRIPVSLSLIVDQEHIDRILTAFSNSKLRFLTTQMLLNRYTSSIRPQLPVENPTGGYVRSPRGYQVQPPPAASEEMETNFELVLYGVVTLYERFPPPFKN